MLVEKNDITQALKWKEIEDSLLTIGFENFVQFELQTREENRHQSEEIPKADASRASASEAVS